jgi:transposase-like protein
MRGVACSVRERKLLMKMRQQGKSLMELSRETGVPRPVLSRWWKRYQKEGQAGLEPKVAVAVAARACFPFAISLSIHL